MYGFNVVSLFPEIIKNYLNYGVVGRAVKARYGAFQVSGDGAFQVSGDGAFQVSGDGASQVSGDGASQVSGDGASQVSGDGASQVSGDGASQVSGDGASQVSGDGASKMIVNIWQLRNFTKDSHQSVDDRPFGGGDGMILLADPLAEVCKYLKSKRILGRVVLVSAHGVPWKDSKARDWASRFKKASHSLESREFITLICGRYGGVDQRFIESFVDEQISMGDFILSGGELASLAMIDSVTRFLPGALGHADSSEKESFSEGLLEHPQFTRPQKALDHLVPEVLLSGNHKKVSLWKQDFSLLKTGEYRPDLLREKRQWRSDFKLACERALQMSEKELEACGLSLQKIKKLKQELLGGSL